MSNYLGIKQELKTYLIARVPLVIVDTGERERVERMLRELAEELSTEIAYYTDARQLERFGRSGGQTDLDNDPLPFAAGMFRKQRGCIFALADARRIGDDCTYSRELLNVLYLAREANGTVILITPDPVWQRLAQFGMVTRLELPDLEERTTQIQRFVRTYSGRFPIDWNDDDLGRAAALLRGFSEMQIENILASALVRHGCLKKSHISELTHQKNRLYASVPAIEQVKIPSVLQVAGLENLKSWLAEKQKVFFSTDEALEARGLTAPRGILLTGISGCGKSLSAKMVAQQWELPLFRFDIGSVYDKWVGESERKMWQALHFLDNVAPCIVWVDEIEKGLSQSDGGNDTGRRVLGQFLFWLQETSSRVFLVATANNIEALPPELFRKGRFSELFFVDLPNEQERQFAITQYCRRSLHRVPEEAQLRQMVQATDGFSYADIEYAVQELAQEALLYGDQTATWEKLFHKITSIIPFAQTHPDTVQYIQRWGRERAVPASIDKREDRK